MAQIIKKQNELEKKYLQTRQLSQLGLGLFFAGMVVAAFNLGSVTMLISLLVAFGGVFLGAYMGKQANIYKAGVSGEGITAEIIRKLPEEYFAVQNLRVTYNDQSSEMDLVVVGPTGVFIVETKNLKGTVVGEAEEKYWTLCKVGRQGTPYSKEFYSPVKQVGTHVYRLANFLRSNGANIRVESAVYFSHPETAVQLNGTPKNTPIFWEQSNGAAQLRQYITGQERRLSPVQIDRIRQLLG